MKLMNVLLTPCCGSSPPRYLHTASRSSVLSHRTSLKTGTVLQAGKQVYALDFDGVVCDSVYESRETAWKAAAKLWPDYFGTEAAKQKKEEVLENMRIVRPVVETGYENVVQVRLLLDGMPAEQMLEDWNKQLAEAMKTLEVERAPHCDESGLVELFGSTRDEWMAADMSGWLGLNRMYAGVPDSVRTAMDTSQVYIVTTKQAHFTDALLENMAGIKFPLDRIFSTTVSGRPKTEVLHMLQGKHPESSYHFVEDKLGTLLKVCEDPSLAAWSLYLVDWGYNTEKERAQAAANPRIQVIDIHRFQQLMAQGSTVNV